MKKRKLGRVIILALILSMLVLPFTIENPTKKSRAVTTATEVKQLDAGYATFGEGAAAKDSYYVTIGWKGTAEHYCMYHVVDGKEGEKLRGVIDPVPAETPGPSASPVSGVSATVAPKTGGVNEFMVTLNELAPNTKYSYRIYEADKDGNRKNSSDTGVLVENIKTTPKKLQTPTLIKVYQNLKESELLFRKDGYSDGYQYQAVTLKGKNICKKDIVGEAASGSSVTGFSLKPSYPGQIVCVRVRGGVDIGNGEMRYGEWSDTVEYGYAKKIKLSGKKDTIKVSGMKVDGAAKKEIYVSLKKNKGYKLAKKVGAKATSAKVSKYGKKYVQSKKTYYIRVYYYYKVGKEMKKSPVYDQDMVFVKPAISYIRVE